MRTLHLTLKKKWFDMILSGEKKEEYREFKDFWVSRLCDKHKGCVGGDFYHKHKNMCFTYRNFNTITFKNGYSSNAPEINIELINIDTGEGNPDWGAEQGEFYFVLKLGEIISTKNIK